MVLQHSFLGNPYIGIEHLVTNGEEVPALVHKLTYAEPWREEGRTSGDS